MRKNGSERFTCQTVGCNVTALRKRADISQTVFAKMIHVNRPYYNGIELGHRNVSVDMLAKIADGLDVPITNLLEGLAEMPPFQAAEDDPPFQGSLACALSPKAVQILREKPPLQAQS